MQRSQLSKVVNELKADKRDLPYGIDVFVKDGTIVVLSKDWDLGFVIQDESNSTIEDYHEAFDNTVPHLIQQIQYKASIH